MNPAWLSAMAQAAIALTGAYVAINWRTQQRESKRAAVAGEVLVATLRYLFVLDRAASLVILGDAPVDADRQAVLRADVSRRIGMVDDVVQDFLEAWRAAETYLPRSVATIIEAIGKEGDALRWSQATFAELPLGHEDPEVRRFVREIYSEGFGSTPRQRIAGFRKEVLQRLRPLAQLGDDSDAVEATR